jgi:NhaP-type Na+/H+ or K+/H+ antiporter
LLHPTDDGAAIVFYSIFSLRYFYELGIPGFGEPVDLARGTQLFFQKSLGGVAVGTFFGLSMLFLLYILDRRFNREESVVEVSATIAIAYLGYYVAEPVWETSGVIATLTAGVLVRFLGSAMINDASLLDDFWTLVEHILNTVLFALGGTVWGAVVASGEKSGTFWAKDWGYLILLYVLLTIIR